MGARPESARQALPPARPRPLDPAPPHEATPRHARAGLWPRTGPAPCGHAPWRPPASPASRGGFQMVFLLNSRRRPPGEVRSWLLRRRGVGGSGGLPEVEPPPHPERGLSGCFPSPALWQAGE